MTDTMFFSFNELKFKTQKDLQEWFNGFSTNLNLLISGSTGPSIQSLINQINSFQVGMNQALASITKGVDAHRVQSNLQSAFNLLNRPVSLLKLSKADFHFIEQVKEKYSQLTVTASVCLLCGLESPIKDRDTVEASFLFMQYLNGSKLTFNSHKKALADLFNSQEKKFDTNSIEHQEHYQKELIELQEVQASILETVNACEKQNQEQQQFFENFIATSTSQAIALEKAFSSELALKAPVTYWTSKKIRHQITMWIFGALTMVATGCFIYIFLMFSELLNQDLSFKIPLQYSNPTPLWLISKLLLVSVVGIWLIRLLSKIYLANMHMAHDAHERIAMLKTFLAMIKEPESSSVKENQEIILSALFRPTTYGLIKDEGPAFPTELIIKNFKG